MSSYFYTGTQLYTLVILFYSNNSTNSNNTTINSNFLYLSFSKIYLISTATFI